MRIVLDMQGAQGPSKYRGIGRYVKSLAEAIIRNRKDHEIIILLNGMITDSVIPTREYFEKFLPKENIVVWEGVAPASYLNQNNSWRRHASEVIQEFYVKTLMPDMYLISNPFEGYDHDCVNTINSYLKDIPTACIIYDFIPLIFEKIYLRGDFKSFYFKQLQCIKNSKYALAISESSRQEAIEYVDFDPSNIVNINAANSEEFFKTEIKPHDEKKVRSKFNLKKPFLMYSSATDERKNHKGLISAFSKIKKEIRENFQLAIVGGMPDIHHAAFSRHIRSHGLSEDDVVLTGRVTDKEMNTLYNICHSFVFPSWHEGFGLPALEAMSCGAATVGANTTSIPEVIGNPNALFDPFSEAEMAKMMSRLMTDEDFLLNLKEHAVKQAAKFSWDKCAQTAITAFEAWHQEASNDRSARLTAGHDDAEALLTRIGLSAAKAQASDQDLAKAARAICENHKESEEKQLLIDISELILWGGHTGIQRVTRAILWELLLNPPTGFRVEPIYASRSAPIYRYARKFKEDFLNPDNIIVQNEEKSSEKEGESLYFDDKIEFFNGDIYLSLDLFIYLESHKNTFIDMKKKGVSVNFIVYDLIPLINPEYFWPDLVDAYRKWISFISDFDSLICISESVANDTIRYLPYCETKRKSPLKINWFHMGSDIAQAFSSKGFPKNGHEILLSIKERKTFLVVGTVEPRKGHQQILDGFEILWQKNTSINLVFIGKFGWNTEIIESRMRKHRLLGKSFFWLEGISDEYLDEIYKASDCLIAGSFAEGFGLPLIEAAQHEIPIIARDIPVFKEVAGNNAYYFSGTEPTDIVNAIEAWLSLQEKNIHPKSDHLSWLTWRQSTEKLKEILFKETSQQTWQPDENIFHFFAGDHRFGTQVGFRQNNEIISTGQQGILLFGPYITVKEGSYKVSASGVMTRKSTKKEKETSKKLINVKISSNKLDQEILSVDIFEKQSDDIIFLFYFDIEKECNDLEIVISTEKNIDIRINEITIEHLK